MASSLQKQLKNIQSNNVLKINKIRRAPSLLYDPKVAADMDLEEIYVTAVSGFHELAVHEPRLLYFEKTLLGEQSVQVDRVLLNRTENEKIDLECVQILRLLAPFFTEKNALKVLEWLIRRFSIHEYVSDEFILSFLPFHDHPFFARILGCSKPKSRPLLFLENAIKMPVTLSRADIVHALSRDKEFFAMFAQFVQNTAESHNMYPELARFWAGAMMEVLVAWHSSNEDPNVLLDRFFLRVSYAVSYVSSIDFQIAGFMLLSSIAASLPLSPSIIPPLVSAITDRLSFDNIKPALICVGHLLQFCSSFEFDHEQLEKLESFDASSLLIELSQEHRLDKFFVSYWVSLIKSRKQKDKKRLISLLDTSISQIRVTHEQAKFLLSVIPVNQDFKALQSYRRILDSVIQPERKEGKLDNLINTLQDKKKSSTFSKKDREVLLKKISEIDSQTSFEQCLAYADSAADLDSSVFISLLSKFGDKIPFLLFCIANGSERITILSLIELRKTIEENKDVDYQIILPVVLYSLQSKDTEVRSRALNLILTFLELRNENLEFSIIYGMDDDDNKNLRWLSPVETKYYCSDLLLDRSSEIGLDGTYLFSYIPERLFTEKKPKNASKEIAVTSFLSSHAACSKLSNVRVLLLEILTRVHGKVEDAKMQILLPRLEQLSEFNSEQFKTVSKREVEALVNCFNHTSFTSLLSFLSSNIVLSQAICRRIVEIQSHLKDPQRLEFVKAVISQDEQPHYYVDVLDSIKIPDTVFKKLIGSVRLVKEKNPAIAKRKRIDSHIFDGDVQRLTRILELLETKNAASYPKLASPLFEVLNSVIALKEDIVSSNYLLQLLLGLLYEMIGASPITELSPSIRIDTLVGCIRSTNNPQIQNKALLLVSALANAAPEAVLHGVMPIFTFMGSTVLSRDDAFSIHVIEQTVKTVISALIRLGKDFDSSLLVSCFVNAFPHIPQHRRLRLYRLVLQTIGSNRFLSVVLIQFAEKMLLAKSTNVVAIHDFCLTLVQSFSVADRIGSINQCSRFCLKSLEEQSNSDSNGKAVSLIKLDELPMDVDLATLGSLRVKVLELISLVSKAKNFAFDLAKIMENSVDSFVEIQAGLFESIKLLITLSQQSSNEMELGHVYVALRSVIHLLPNELFCTVLGKLLHDERALLRRKALSIVQQRVQQGSKVSALTALIPDVTYNISNYSDEETTQLAMDCLAVMAKRFSASPELFISPIEVVSGPYGLKNSARDVQVSAIVCITVLTNTLAARILPYLADIVNYSLSILDDARKDPEGDLLELACFSMMIDFFKVLPEFSSSYVEPTIKCALASDRAFEHDAIGELLFETIANFIPTRLLMKSIFAAWPECARLGSTAALRLLELIELALQNSSRSAIGTVYKSIFKFFLDSFDSRRSLLFAEDVDNVETQAVNVFLKFVMKLSDTTFRPLFLHLHSWALEDLYETDPSGIVSRQTFFYNFLTIFLDTLKSIVTNYYAYVLDDTIELLSSKDTNSEVRHLVNSSLVSAFENDTEEFWMVPARFGKISPVLIEQIQYAPLLDDKVLVKAIVELASVASSSDNFRSMNTQLLQYLRSSNINARLLAIQIQTQLYGRLGENWISTLPQSVPFIAELMEDDDDQVETATAELVRIIDDRLGENESLQDYLT